MADQNINNMSVTWNSGGTTFAAEKMNVTDTASAAASLLQQWQVGGVNKWTVSKGGAITAAGGATIGGNSTITGTLGVTGAFSAAGISGTTGSFSGAVSGTTGSFSGTLITADEFTFDSFITSSDLSVVLSVSGGLGAITLRPHSGDSNQDTTIDGAGNMTVGGNVTASSDRRLKKKVRTIKNALDLVRKLRGVHFTRRSNNAKSIGVIAQEVEAVLPDVVFENDEGFKSVAYGNMVAVLIEAVKELARKVDRLEAK